MKIFYNFRVYKLFIALLFSLLLTNIYGQIYCKCNDHNTCLSPSFKGNLNNFTDFYCIIPKKGHCYSARAIELLNEETQLPITAQIIHRFGCLSTTTKSILSCKGHYINLTTPVAIECCNKTNFCNTDIFPSFYHHNNDKAAIEFALSHYRQKRVYTISDPKDNIKRKPVKFIYVLIFGVPICVIIFIILIAFLLFYRKRFQKQFRLSKNMLRQSTRHNGSLVRLNEEQYHASCPDTAFISLNNGSVLASVMTGSSLMTNSLSGGGGPSGSKVVMSQRTVGNQILIQELLGKGRFSEVWSGEWLGEPVSVRLMVTSPGSNIAETLWLRSVGLYYSCLLRHGCVVGLLGSDKMAVSAPAPGATDHCLVFRPMLLYPHFPLGTLSQLMLSSYWDLTDVTTGATEEGATRLEILRNMALSIVAGLCYLHTEIAATKGKPAIAHRNLKPSNIYVKDDYSCCVGDLEWALVSGSSSGSSGSGGSNQFPLSNYSGTGTGSVLPPGLKMMADFESQVLSLLMTTSCRYVAPEYLRLLEPPKSMGRQPQQRASIEDYRKSDMYSLSLVLWELLVWFEPNLIHPLPVADDIVSPPKWCYQPAYEQELCALRHSGCGGEPNPTEMASLVLHQQLRPPLLQPPRSQATPAEEPLRTSQNDVTVSACPVLNIVQCLCDVIPQCWGSIPDSRLTVLNIKKSLMRDPSTSTHF